jgi:DNA-binding response OmpR family regulator
VPARIVVVDDDEALRNVLRRALRLEGYDVQLARDGSEGLDHLARPGADLVVLDVLMPGHLPDRWRACAARRRRLSGIRCSATSSVPTGPR